MKKRKAGRDFFRIYLLPLSNQSVDYFLILILSYNTSMLPWYFFCNFQSTLDHWTFTEDDLIPETDVPAT